MEEQLGKRKCLYDHNAFFSCAGWPHCLVVCRRLRPPRVPPHAPGGRRQPCRSRHSEGEGGKVFACALAGCVFLAGVGWHFDCCNIPVEEVSTANHKHAVTVMHMKTFVPRLCDERNLSSSWTGSLRLHSPDCVSTGHLRPLRPLPAFHPPTTPDTLHHLYFPIPIPFPPARPSPAPAV